MNHWQVRAIELLASRYDFGAGSLHAHKVAALASSLFDQLSHHGLLPKLTPSDRRTLVAAGYAHDIGLSSRAFEDAGGLPLWARSDNPNDSHHIISFEILRTHIDNEMISNGLPLCSAVDRSTLLYSVLWGSSGSNRTVDSEPLVGAETTALLSGVLRIADALDVRHRLMVQQVELRRTSAWLRLLIHTFDEAGAEVAAAQESADMLTKQLGLRLFVQEVIPQVRLGAPTPTVPFSLQPEDEEYLDALLASKTILKSDKSPE